jgi:hypothetical protein
VNTAIMATAASMTLLLSVGFLGQGPSGEARSARFSHRPAPTVRVFEVSRFRWTSPSAACREDVAGQPGVPDCAFVEAACGVGPAGHSFVPMVWISRAFTLVCAELVIDPAR